MTINTNVTLDQRKVNVESFGISRQRSYQIGRSDIRQNTIPCSPTAPISQRVRSE